MIPAAAPTSAPHRRGGGLAEQPAAPSREIGTTPLSYPPTPEQQAAIDAFTTGNDLVLQAGAGAGKTSTLRFLAGAKPNANGLYITYNKANAVDAKRSFPRTVKCATSHSLAFVIGARYKHRFNAPRLPARQNAVILGITQPIIVSKDLPPLAPWQIAGYAIRAVERFFHSAEPELLAQHVPWPRGYKPADYEAFAKAVLPYAQAAWRDYLDPDGRLKYPQDAYLKQWALCGPKLEADFAMLDEAQDANPLLTGVMLNQGHIQRIAVGDSCQQLYAWRGAEDALSILPGRQLTLSQSFRFGQAVADEANKWLDLLEAPLALRGYDKIASRLDTLHRPDAILCRTNAGCMTAAMKLMADGVRVAIVGGGQAVQQLAYAAIDLKAGRTTSHPELVAFASWEEVREYADSSDGADLKPMVDLIEEHGPERIIAATKALSSEDRAQVTVSTAHKSKGREWATVQIGPDFYAPKPDPKTGERLVSRPMAMLAYVAVTRAREVLDRKNLAWVDELDGVIP